MKISTSPILLLVVALGLFIPVQVSAGPSGRAAGTARQISVNFDFKLAAALRPSAPADVQIVSANKGGLTLSWAPSAAKQPDRGIEYYEVLRNGVKIAQTTQTQIEIALPASGAALDILSVRAVDTKGAVSGVSAEVMAPDSPGLDFAQFAIEQKKVFAKRTKGGFRTLLSDRRFKHGTYAYVMDQKFRYYDYYEVTTKEDRNFVGSYDAETGRWSLDSASGSYRSEVHVLTGGVSPEPETGAWIASDHYPPAALLKLADGSIRTGWSLFSGSFAVASATSDTFAHVVDTHEGTDLTIELSDELTEAEFRSGLEREYASGLEMAAGEPWDSRLYISFGEVKTNRASGLFNHVAERVEYDEGDVMTLVGGVYRLRPAGRGVRTIRWAEVTLPDDGSEPRVVLRQETVDLDQPEPHTGDYVVAPPDVPGTTAIRILSAELAVAPLASLLSSSRADRLLARNSVYAGGVAEIVVGTGPNWFDPAGSATAVLTFSGPAGAVRFLAIDPQVEATEGLEAAVAAGVEIAVGTDLLQHPNTPGFGELGGWKLLAVGVAPGEGLVEVALGNGYEAAANVVQTPLRVLPQMCLRVDGNRDGVIRLPDEDQSDEITAERPFRFWVNDDADQGDASGLTDFSDDTNLTANFRDEVINGTRDLVDFFPVFLNVREMLAVYPPSASVKYRLWQADGALNFAYTNQRRQAALDYETKLLASGFGDDFDRPASAASTHQITAQGVELSGAFLEVARGGEGGVILVEARSASNAPLVLTVEQDGSVLAEARLALRTGPVEAMFRHLNLADAAKSYEGRTLALPEYVPPTRIDDPGDAWPDSETNGKYLVFIHGFNIDGRNARGWQSEIFKRLHVLGSKARFVGVTWHGATGVKVLGGYTDYHQAVFNAFQTGDALPRALEFTKGADVTVVAHSLGNVVASQAIEAGGSGIRRYVLINAAVPLEAYDLKSVNDRQRFAMTERKWKNLGDPSTFAANWHGWFSPTPADFRGALKWGELFKNAAKIALNFYSPGDEVLEDAEWDSPSILKLLFERGFNFSRGAWVTQELAKGASFFESAAVAFLSRTQGGWGQSVYYWPTGSLPPSPDQTREPYFGYFLERDLFDADAAKASAKAANPIVKYDLLARALPAMSFAAAAHPISSGDTPDAGPVLNFDLEAQGRSQGVWPTEGHRESSDVGRWLHSDFKNVALPFVHPMYKELINQASLK